MSQSRNITVTDVKPNDTVAALNYFGAFKDQFLLKSFNTVILNLTDNLLKEKGYNTTQIERIKNIVHISLIAFQGSLKTSGSSLGVTELMKYYRFSDDNAFWTGFTTGIIINLALNFTPMGAVKTAVVTLGSVAGKQTAKWAYNQAKMNFFNPHHEAEPKIEVEHPSHKNSHKRSHHKKHK